MRERYAEVLPTSWQAPARKLGPTNVSLAADLAPSGRRLATTFALNSVPQLEALSFPSRGLLSFFPFHPHSPPINILPPAASKTPHSAVKRESLRGARRVLCRCGEYLAPLQRESLRYVRARMRSSSCPEERKCLVYKLKKVVLRRDLLAREIRRTNRPSSDFSALRPSGRWGAGRRL